MRGERGKERKKKREEGKREGGRKRKAGRKGKSERETGGNDGMSGKRNHHIGQGINRFSLSSNFCLFNTCAVLNAEDAALMILPVSMSGFDSAIQEPRALTSLP